MKIQLILKTKVTCIGEDDNLYPLDDISKSLKFLTNSFRIPSYSATMEETMAATMAAEEDIIETISIKQKIPDGDIRYIKKINTAIIDYEINNDDTIEAYYNIYDNTNDNYKRIYRKVDITEFLQFHNEFTPVLKSDVGYWNIVELNIIE